MMIVSQASLCLQEHSSSNKEKMEIPPSLPYAHQPVRSISLPTRVHPSSQRVEALLKHLKPHSDQSISATHCFEAETIQNDLLVVAELYNCMEELLQSSQTQQSLLHYENGKLIEDALSVSVTLLDACGSARDLLLVLKEQVQKLMSALRRRRRDSSIESSISAYLTFRKKAKKEIAKQLGVLKRMDSKVNSFSLLAQDQNLVLVDRVLRDASTIIISIFRSLLLFLSMPGLKTKGSSLISKLIPTRLISSEKEQKISSEAVFLCSLLGKLTNNNDGKVEVEGAQRGLESLNASINGLDGGLDCIFRCLIKNRVTFLNMLTQ